MAKDETHECAAKGCSAQITHRLLMCFRHWRMVPANLQRALFNAYRKVPGGGGRADLTPQYLQAMEACVKAVAAAEGSK